MTGDGWAEMQTALGCVALFRDAEAADVKALAAMCDRRAYAAGETIFASGDRGQAMMAVLDGRVSIAAGDGEIGIIEPGGVFGEVAFLDGGERTADAAALDDTTLLVLSRADFLPFLERRPALAIGLLRVLCERLRNAERRLASRSS